MAFLQKVGNLVKRSAGTSSSLFQAVRLMSSSKLFVGGISYGTDDQSLREAFANYGQVIEARVIMDRETGRSRGFGFVTYTSTEEAAAAITGMDGKDLQGRMVRVNYAHDRGSRAGGFGSGGDGGGYGSGGYAGDSYGSGGYAGDSYGNGGYRGGRGSYAGSGGYPGGGRYNDGGYAGDSYGSGGYAGGGRYNDGGNVGSGYNTGGNYGVYEGGQGGYGNDAGYTGGSNTAPGNYGGGSFNQEGDAPGAYGGANYGTTNDNYVNNASDNASAGKLDDLLSDLKVDSAGGAEASSKVGDGFADDDLKDGVDFLQDDIGDDDNDDYASKRS